MDRKRGVATRPAASEEIELWNRVRTPLLTLSSIYTNPATAETIGRVNRLISAWPNDDTVPSEGLDGVKTIYKKLNTGLKDLETASNNEVKAIDQALDKLGILIALRQATETAADKRNKRPNRGPSPSSTPTPVGAPPASGAARGVSITLPPRNSAGTPLSIAVSREKSRREGINRQLPLREGRTIAFHPPPKPIKDADQSDWILAVITRCINSDKHKYEVRDVDDENPETYTTTTKSIIPLPDPNAPAGAPESISVCPEYGKGTIVLALYPDTSFTPPRDMQPTGRSYLPTYELKFEDDEEQSQIISAQYVVEFPKD
ncbi:SGF29 tudor-like domain-containing protein [Armillaria luteobubalina]|uniref:SGF29 tudor-like domain-containing protein n=1 Tax=Armillaria luteobubalina TaxID=153913 RepID=A0AA39QKM3_9AGAR|nr:SGF29 tudor-like domain-containing protein [Armillaria luteobubalina]